MRAANQLNPLEVYRLPRPAAPAFTGANFTLCAVAAPTALWCCQQALYLLAFEQAQAVAQPSLLERDLAGVWN